MGQLVSKDGTAIAFDRVGQGPPVILVVGALCSRTFGPGPKLAAALADRFTAYTYDRRGRGDSGPGSPEDAAHSVEREVEDLAAVVAEAGGRASVFGHSSGAMLALDAAARGVPIDRLALYEPPLIVDAGRLPIVEEWSQIEAFVAGGRRADAVKVFLRSVGVPALLSAAMRWMPIWSRLEALAPTLPRDAALVRDYQKGAPLPAATWVDVEAPALVIAGGKSPAWMKSGARALAEALPNGKQRVLEGQTHDVRARAVAPVLTEFFGYKGRSCPDLSPAVSDSAGRSM
jgi:pimeloyl-ACP methyl ester carboxylesterase